MKKLLKHAFLPFARTGPGPQDGPDFAASPLDEARSYSGPPPEASVGDIFDKFTL